MRQASAACSSWNDPSTAPKVRCSPVTRFAVLSAGRHWQKGKTEVRFVADAGGLRDEFVREIAVAPRGFPQNISKSGRLKDNVVHEVELAGLMDGTSDAHLKIYVSQVSTLIAGLDGMLSEPGGCFEQTSSDQTTRT